MAKPASSSPAKVTITKHRMIDSVLRHVSGGREPALGLPVVAVPPSSSAPSSIPKR